MRIALLERAAGADWNDREAEQLAQLVVACVRPDTFAQSNDSGLVDHILPQDILQRVLKHIHDNLDSRLSWRDIASAVGLEPFSFGRSFRLTTQLTPHQYVIRCRLKRAMTLLAREELDIAGIAFEVGCASQSHLTRLFRKYVGMTPAAFRKAGRSLAFGGLTDYETA